VKEYTGGLRAAGSKATQKFDPAGLEDLTAVIDQVRTRSEELTAQINALREASQRGSEFAMYMRAKARFMTDLEFLFFHASGTLRKTAELNYDYKRSLVLERVAFDFGYGFAMV
jgi:hypothetical protein